MATERSAPLVWCAYPVTGMYTQAFRILLWAVFALLVLPYHIWISPLVLGFNLTYIITTTVHAVVLGAAVNSAHDTDVFAIQVVLQFAIYASLLLLLFSPKIFSRDVAPFIVASCYCLLIPRMVMQYGAIPNISRLDDLTVPV